MKCTVRLSIVHNDAMHSRVMLLVYLLFAQNPGPGVLRTIPNSIPPTGTDIPPGVVMPATSPNPPTFQNPNMGLANAGNAGFGGVGLQWSQAMRNGSPPPGSLDGGMPLGTVPNSPTSMSPQATQSMAMTQMSFSPQMIQRSPNLMPHTRYYQQNYPQMYAPMYNRRVMYGGYRSYGRRRPDYGF